MRSVISDLIDTSLVGSHPEARGVVPASRSIFPAFALTGLNLVSTTTSPEAAYQTMSELSVPNRLMEHAPIVSPNGTNMLRGPLSESATGWIMNYYGTPVGLAAHVQSTGSKITVEMAQLDGPQARAYTKAELAVPAHDPSLNKVFINKQPVQTFGCAQQASISTPECAGVGVESMVQLTHRLGQDSRLYVFRDDELKLTIPLGGKTVTSVDTIKSDLCVAKTSNMIQTPEGVYPDALTLIRPYMGRVIPLNLLSFQAPDGTRLNPTSAQLTVTTLSNSSDEGQLVIFDKNSHYIYFANVDYNGTVSVVRARNTFTNETMQFKTDKTNLGGLFFSEGNFHLLGIRWNGGTSYTNIPDIVTRFTSDQNPSLIGVQETSDKNGLTYYVKTRTGSGSTFGTQIVAVTVKTDGKVEQKLVHTMPEWDFSDEGEQVVTDAKGRTSMIVNTGLWNNERRAILSEPLATFLPMVVAGNSPSLGPSNSVVGKANGGSNVVDLNRILSSTNISF